MRFIKMTPINTCQLHMLHFFIEGQKNDNHKIEHDQADNRVDP